MCIHEEIPQILNPNKTYRDFSEDVNGQVIGSFYFQGILFYDGRSQSQPFYALSEEKIKETGEKIIQEKKTEFGEIFKEIWPKNSWEIRIIQCIINSSSKTFKGNKMNKIYRVIGNLDDEDSKTPYHSFPIGTLVIRTDEIIAFPDGPWASYNVTKENGEDHTQMVSIADLKYVETETLLQEYSNEIDPSGIVKLTLEKLIESHRFLRTLNIENMTQKRNAYQDALKFHTDSFNGRTMIDLEELEGMTIAQICELVKEKE